jgi:hypothetical protein
VADAIQTADHSARFVIEAGPGEQLIWPELVQRLRQLQVAGIGPRGANYAGTLLVSAATGDLSGITVAARTSTPGGGGRYGLFYPALPEGETSLAEAWIYGLQQNSTNRSNLALVNTGEVDKSPARFQIELYDGASGLRVGNPLDLTLEAGRWFQFGMILTQYAPAVPQAYARITRTSGWNPFLVYAVINDGASPGLRSGDGTFIPSSP